MSSPAIESLTAPLPSMFDTPTDPNDSLSAIRAGFVALGKRLAGDAGYVDDLLDIAEHAARLDGWLSHPCGGSLPDAWAVGR